MSTAARCAGEMSLADCPNAPVEPVAANALTVLIGVPTVEVGEADEGAVELARILGANGHRAVVVSNGGRLELSLAASGTETIRLDMTSRSPPAIVYNAFALKRIIAQRRCAIVHALARAPAWSALIAARMAGVPFVTTWYNGFREQNSRRSDPIAEAIATRYNAC
jgi:Glycosyltransferase Family 4